MDSVITFVLEMVVFGKKIFGPKSWEVLWQAAVTSGGRTHGLYACLAHFI